MNLGGGEEGAAPGDLAEVLRSLSMSSPFASTSFRAAQPFASGGAAPGAEAGTGGTEALPPCASPASKGVAPEGSPPASPCPPSSSPAAQQHKQPRQRRSGSRSRSRSPPGEPLLEPKQSTISSARGSGHPLERMLSSAILSLTPAELTGPCEVRTLLPGVDLAEHGMDEEAMSSGEAVLPVLRAPLGLSLKEALNRLSSAEMSRDPSFALGGQYVQPGASSHQPTAQQLQQQSRASSLPRRASAAAASPPSAGLAGTRAPTSLGRPPRSPAPDQPALQPSLPPGSSATLAAAAEQLSEVAPRESSAKENRVQAQGQQQPQEKLAAAAFGEAAAPLQGMEGPFAAAAGPAQPSQPDDIPEAPRQQRPWTVDGTPGSLPGAASELKAAELDAHWQARSAARMWPMLAPFVPRILRDDILSPKPRCRSIYDIMTAAKPPEVEDRLPLAMKPCTELLPAAVMVADITGFTALTEALSTKGSAGVELLTKCMNRYFSQVIELLLEYKGDIMKFAGDSMIVAFWPTAEEAAACEDGGLRVATLRAAACAHKLTDKFGAMRMLSSGDAIPVPRAERARDAEEQAPEWFEDIVNRAEHFFVTGPEQLVETAFKPMAAFIAGAAKPVGSAVIHGTGTVGRGALATSVTVARHLAPRRVSSRFRGSRHALESTSPAAASSGSPRAARPIKRVHSTPSLGSASAGAEAPEDEEPEEMSEVAEGDEAASTHGSGEAGAEEQQGEVKPARRRRRLVHSRSVAGGLVTKLAHVAAAPIAGVRGAVRRSHSDAMAAAQELAEQESGAVGYDSAMPTLSRVVVAVRPPELPHRSEAQSRGSPAPDGSLPSPSLLPRPVVRTSTAPPDILGGIFRTSPAPRSTSGSLHRVTQATASVSQFDSDADAVSASGASFTSSISQLRHDGDHLAQQQRSPRHQSPWSAKAWAAEEPAAEGYEVVTVTAGGPGVLDGTIGTPLPGGKPASLARTSAVSFQLEPAKSGSFPWSKRFSKLLKKAKKAPKKLWKASGIGVPKAGSSGPSLSSTTQQRGLSADQRAVSTLSSASGISNLESLAVLSRRVWSTAQQQQQRGSQGRQHSAASPLGTPSNRFMRRRHASYGHWRSLSAGMPAAAREDPKLLLSLKVLLSAGMVCTYHVGGGQQSSVADPQGTPRWEFFIGDPPRAAGQGQRSPIFQLAGIEPLARAGEAVLSEEVAELLGDACLVEQLPGTAVLLLKVNDPPQMVPEMLDRPAQELAALTALPEVAQGRALQVLRMHLLENVRLRIEAGHIDYVNEIRVCTVLFLGFPSINHLLDKLPPGGMGEAVENKLVKVQQAIEVVQKKMRQYDGSFVQFRADEKGFLAICAFGLPGRSHEDGPARGIQAAVSIVEALKKRGGQAVVGVTTGQLFCAMVGSRRRLEYTVFGDAINLAARLMVKAKEGLATVLCDAATQHLAQSKAYYHALEPLHVKGKRLAVEVYAVTPLYAERQAAPMASQGTLALTGTREQQQGQAQGQLAPVPALDMGRMMSTHYSTASEAQAAAAKPMIGREELVEAIVARVQQLVEQRKGGLVLIEGDPGMGKTRLVEELQRSELGGLYDKCNMFAGYGRSDRKSQSLYPWRRIFREIFVHDRAFGQLYCLRDRNPQQQHVVVTELGRRLQDAPGNYGCWVHLLADTLDLPLTDFPITPPHTAPTLMLSPMPTADQSARALALQPLPLSVSRALRDTERDFVVDMDRPRSFAMRLKRSASATQPRVSPGVRAHSPTKLPPRPETPESPAASASSSSSAGMRSSPSSPAKASVLAARGSAATTGPDMLTRAATARGLPTLVGSAHGGAAPTTAQEREISGHLKSKKVLELLMSVLQQFAEAYGPLILILEDLHFFDSASWRLLVEAVGELGEGVMFVATARPVFSNVQANLRQLAPKDMLHKRIEAAYRTALKLPSTVHIVLQPLGVEQTRQLLASLVGTQVEANLAQLVWEKSNGLPSFIEQFAVFLQHQLSQQQAAAAAVRQAAAGPLVGHSVSAGRVGLEVQDSVSLPGPELVLSAMDAIRNTVTIHSTVTDRVDRLRPEEQLTLKVASVQGTILYADLLQMSHPQQPSRQQIEAHLHGLEAADFVKRDPEDATVWVFCQVLARDVVYDLIPVGQQRDWHGRLAFVMELCQADHNLPANTIAYHWAAACKNIETVQWWRTMKAIENWEKAANEAITRAAYADGLPLLQKAQVLASVLAEYYGTDEEEVARKVAAQPLLPPESLGTLPSGLVQHLSGSSLHSLISIHGSQRDPGTVATLPLIPQLRRVHWERCMAAMCLASEISQQSLNLAMLHCLQALVLLGVPMPWDPQYRRRRRWWHCSFDACFVAGLCCFSSSLSHLREAGPAGAEPSQAGEAGLEQSQLQPQRVGEMEIADMVWLAHPGTLMDSLQVPQHLLIKKGQQAAQQAGDLVLPLPNPPLPPVAEGAPAAQASSHVEWWHDTQLPEALAAQGGSTAGPAAGPASATAQQQGGQGPAGPGRPEAGSSGVGPQALQPGAGGASFSMVSPFASAAPASSKGIGGTSGSLAAAVASELFEQPGSAPAASAARAAAAVPLVGAQPNGKGPAMGGQQARPLAPSQHQISGAHSEPALSQRLHAQHSWRSWRSQRTMASGEPSGSIRPEGGVAPRLGGEEALEAAIVLEILTNVLLTPEHLDLEALRYVMWVCKKLEGKRVHEASLYHSAWVSCANALHQQRRQSRAGILVLQPLAGLAGVVVKTGERVAGAGARLQSAVESRRGGLEQADGRPE